MVKEKEVKIKEKEEEKTLLRQEYDILRFWEIAFSEKGMVKFIIRNILDYFNERCNYYLSYLTGGRFSILFNEELKESIVNNGRSVSYISLSGGELRKFNLAVTLGLQSLLAITETEKSDILFLDEITNGIDTEGITGIYSLLQDLKAEKTIFLISHDATLRDLLVESDRLIVEKIDGVTTLANARD